MAYFEAAMAVLSAGSKMMDENKEEEYRNFIKTQLSTIIKNTEEIISEIKLIKTLIDDISIKTVIASNKSSLNSSIDLIYQFTTIKNGRAYIVEGFEEQFKSIILIIIKNCNELKQLSYASYPIVYAGLQTVRFALLHRGLSNDAMRDILRNLSDVYIPWYEKLLDPSVEGSFGALLAQAAAYKLDIPYVDSLKHAGIGGWMLVGIYPRVDDHEVRPPRHLGGVISDLMTSQAAPLGGGPINNWSGWFDGNFETGFAMTAFELRHDPYPAIYGWAPANTTSEYDARLYGHHISGEISSRIRHAHWYKTNIDELNTHASKIHEIITTIRRVFPNGVVVLS